MKIIKYIKTTILLLLTFLLGATPTHAKTEALRFESLANVIHLSDDAAALAGYSKLGTIEEVYVVENGITKLEDVAIYKNADDVLAWRGLANVGSDWFSLSSFKNIPAKIPGGANKTNIGKTLWNDAYKITPPNGSSAKNIFDDIIANGDALGTKTEGLVDDIMTAKGYKIADGKYFGANGNNGFDGVYYKGTLDNPTEIIIIESKQMSATGSVTLGAPNANTGLPSQMRDAWIQYVAGKLNDAGKTDIADMIIDNPNLIKKYVSAVDKVESEINFLKLGNY